MSDDVNAIFSQNKCKVGGTKVSILSNNIFVYEYLAFFLGEVALSKIFMSIIGVRVLIFKSNLLR